MTGDGGLDDYRKDEAAATRMFDEVLGPFYTAEDTREYVGFSAAEFEMRASRGDVLVLVTTDRFELCPAFQFGDARTLLSGLGAGLTELVPQLGVMWLAALWLIARTDHFGGHTAVELLRTGDVESVITAARRDAARWSE